MFFLQDVDGIACSFFLTMDRVERMDFTFHTFSDGFSLVVPKPEEESRLFAFIGPFQPNVMLIPLFDFRIINWFVNKLGLDVDLYLRSRRYRYDDIFYGVL